MRILTKGNNKPESNENHYYNYVALFFWLYENTEINNNELLKPCTIKQEFLKDFPRYENYNIVLTVGKCLNLIYGNQLKRTNLFNKELRKNELFYNLELLPDNQKKNISINGKRWEQWT